jgi:hypothetical protein
MRRSDSEADARRRGRRSAMTALYAVTAVFVALAGGNVTWQVWAPSFSAFPAEECRAGLSRLASAVARARSAAGNLSTADEDAALGEFRAALRPEWDRRDAIARACQSSGELVQALDVIDRLRYAEERAVRREVSELAPLRRRTEQILMNELDR